MSAKRVRSLRVHHPLNDILHKIFAGNTSARGSSKARTKPINTAKDPPKAQLYSRIEIVSEKLCDDLIKYLAPTLRPYQGCTILDVHPGACLWSRKLHALLKPRCHILMEPDERYMKDFIKPLLKRPGSRYKHSALPFVDEWGRYKHPYAQVLEDARGPGFERLPSLHTSSLEYDDPRLRLVNAGLLVTGNLARYYQSLQPYQLLYREVVAALDNSLAHRNGLVRQLWWLPDDPKHKSVVLPHVVSGRNTSNLMLALAAEVTEVAGVDLADKTANKPTRDNKTLTSQPRIRNSAINAENNLQVKQRMNLAGMAVPAGRKLLRHSEGRDGELKDPFIIRYHSVEEISKAIDEFDTFLDTIRAVANQGWSRLHITSGTSGLEGLVAGIEYPQCIPAAVENAPSPMSATQRNEDGITAQVQRKAIYLDITLRMINLETHVVVLREKGVDIEDLKARLFKLDKEIQEELMPGLPEMCHTIVEDQILHFTTPQICMYDRRKCEPLRAAHDDFWPKSGLALYDCMPSSRDLDVWDIAQRPEVVQLTRELSKLLFGRKASSISTALDHCATNAAQDLIPKVPALTDPRKGGRLNPNNMLTRMISEEAFEGLVKAWFEWPFKPDRYDLEVSALGKKQFMGPIDGNTEASGKSVKSKKGSGRRRKSVAA